MSDVRAYFKTQSAAAMCAERLRLDAEPVMTAPYQSRTWMIEVPVDSGHGPDVEGADVGVVLALVNRLGGVLDTSRPSPGRVERNGGAPFMDGLPRDVVDRFEGGPG